MNWSLRILDDFEELTLVEDLQRKIWHGSDADIVPAHMLHAAIQNGGLLIGAFNATGQEENPQDKAAEMIGFVFGFPGYYLTPDGPRLKHCSHMLGVTPEFRNQGIGFALKRSQWQMVRRQGIDLITWTYDPLLSPNAHLNIARLGAVCSTYHRNYYGMMRDELNAGLPSDRFQVDWWLNTRRVNHRLSRLPRPGLRLSQLMAAQVPVMNPATFDSEQNLHPSGREIPLETERPPLVMVEIPSDFHAIKRTQPTLAFEWRLHTRTVFERLFEAGYLVTDFIYETSAPARSYYVLSHGEATL